MAKGECNGNKDECNGKRSVMATGGINERTKRVRLESKQVLTYLLPGKPPRLPTSEVSGGEETAGRIVRINGMFCVVSGITARAETRVMPHSSVCFHPLSGQVAVQVLYLAISGAAGGGRVARRRTDARCGLRTRSISEHDSHLLQTEANNHLTNFQPG